MPILFSRLACVGRRAAGRFYAAIVPAFAAAVAVAACAARLENDDSAAFPPELVAFQAASGEPVFAGRGAGHWDARIRERGWILKEGDLWRMWYTGYADRTRMSLGYATSPDGLKWVRREEPLIDEFWVEDMMIVVQDGTYWMFAEGLNDEAQLLSSKDGLAWTREGKLDIRKTDGTPISSGPYGTPTAWFENGTWNLFYERRDLGIWLARSKDMKVWVNVQDDPVIALGPGKYDKAQVAMNQIVKHGGRYYAYYHGSGSESRPQLWTTNVAVSDDLIHWTKYAGNPLFPEADNLSSGILVHDGKQFRLYTMHDRVRVHFPRRP